jgi:hypothetical protein
MNRFKSMLAATVLAATAALTPAANAATTLHVVAAGSSALYQPTALAAFNDLAPGFVPAGGSGPYHFTNKGAGFLRDTRSAPIPDEFGNLWVVWVQDSSGNATDVWIDLSVDSTVGNRAFFAVDGNNNRGVQVQLGTITSGTAGSGLIVSNLWSGGVCGSGSNCDSNLPASLVAFLNNNQPRVNAGFTDIRPEDAKFATNRANGTLNTSTYAGLGYGTGTLTAVGTPIRSAFSTAQATPVNFAITGTDPISKKAHRPYTTIPIGASPVIYVTNRSNASGLGQGVAAKAPIYNNVTDFYVKSVSKTGVSSYTFPISQLFGGFADCDGNSVAFTKSDNKTPVGGGTFPVAVMLREPLSGTYNTTEFTTIRIFGGQKTPTTTGPAPHQTQEHGVNPGLGSGAAGSSNNPLFLNCPSGGARYRGIGTGEVMNGGSGGPFGIAGGVLNTTDSIGYAFFSFGNISKLAAGGANYGYLKLDGVDGIFANYNGGDPGQPATSGGVPGQLPTCSVVNNGTPGGCEASDIWNNSTYGPSYPNLRNGTYRAWSLLRVVAEPTNTDVPALVAAAQNEVDTKLADFVPFVASGPDPGLTVYREHFKLAGVSITPANGCTNPGASGNFSLGGGTPGGICPSGSGTPEAGGDVGGLIQGPFLAVPPVPGPVCNNTAASATVDVPFCYTHGQQ